MLLDSTFSISSTDSKLELMKNSSYPFQLTGSRFFGTDTAKSDWDFFVQDTPEVKEWLMSLGFFRHGNQSPYAGDGLCTGVMVFNGYNPSRETDPADDSAQIHVQLVNDFSLKQKIQIKLKGMCSYGVNDEYDHFPTDKFLARVLWKQAFAFYSMGLNDGFKL